MFCSRHFMDYHAFMYRYFWLSNSLGMPVIFSGVARQGGTVLATCFDQGLWTRDRTEIERAVRDGCPAAVHDGWRRHAQLEAKLDLTPS